MAGRKSLLLLIAACTTLDCVSPAPTIKAAYWPSWVAQRFPASAINTTFFTHIYYAFVLPDPVSYRLAVYSPDDTLMPNFTATLHSQDPAVKALLSIGGGGSNSLTFSLMANKSSTREAFINSTVAVARQYGFDGLDLDWEFPADFQDMANLGRLFAEWRLALKNEALTTGRKRLLLTAAVYFSASFFLSSPSRSYPAGSVRRNLHWVNAMCFDYHGAWDTSETGAHAALYDTHSNISTSFGIDSWISAGVPSNKVVMGLPLYGHTWSLEDPGEHGIGAPAVGVGPGNRGLMKYVDIESFIEANNATVVYDNATVSTYSYKGNAWIGYDDATSVTNKIQFALGRRLGGYFFWAVNGDKNWTISQRASNAWDN